MIRIAMLLATCHTPTPPLVACALFPGLVSSLEELLDSVGSTDDAVLEEDFGPDPLNFNSQPFKFRIWQRS